MNGKDGKPFKTREGGVMRLEYLIEEINEAVYQKIQSGQKVPEEEACLLLLLIFFCNNFIFMVKTIKCVS